MPTKTPKKQSVAARKKISVDWQQNSTGTELVLTKKFRSYLTAFMFVTRVAVTAEVLRAYPEIRLTATEVKIVIKSTTGLTKLDLALADKIDELVLSTTKD